MRARKKRRPFQAAAKKRRKEKGDPEKLHRETPGRNRPWKRHPHPERRRGGRGGTKPSTLVKGWAVSSDEKKRDQENRMEKIGRGGGYKRACEGKDARSKMVVPKKGKGT